MSGESHQPDGASEAAVRRGRAAYARGAWREAHRELSAADGDSPLGAEDLERLAWSSGLIGKSEQLLQLLERLHRLHLEQGDRLRAARMAFWLGFRLQSLEEQGRASGWFGRSEALVAEHGGPCAEAGYLQLPLAQRCLAKGDREGALAATARAVELGTRYGERDLLALAWSLEGRARLGGGEVSQGLVLLDQAMVAATSGELSTVVTGLVYCIAVEWCQRVYALDRAREWTLALGTWCESQPELVTFSGACRLHRAEVLELNGEWSEAGAEAQRLLVGKREGLEPGAGSQACYRKAEIHRLRGEFAEAEQGYRQASQQGRNPHPGLALLRLVQGRTEAAVTGIATALAAVADPLQRARLLPATVEIRLAAGDLTGAREASDELGEITRRFEGEVLAAMAAHARGLVELAEGRAGAALERLGQAFATWQRAGAPFVAARIRVSIALARRALGDEEGAELELGSAQEVFQRLGAAPELARLERLRASSRGTGGLSPRELEVLRLVAAGKTNREIARALFRSEKTIDRHLSNILLKLGVPSRAAATSYAHRHGLL
jgi:DNA-binding CsgD family transcriptional regulator